jgi:hypothetical protein
MPFLPGTGPLVRQAFVLGVRRHLHVLDLATGAVHRVTDGDWDAGDPAWSQNGTRLASAAAIDPDADLTLTSAAYVVAAVGGTPRKIAPAQGIVDGVTWVPDGGDPADLVLTAADPSEVAPHELRDLPVIATLLAGRPTYQVA